MLALVRKNAGSKAVHSFLWESIFELYSVTCHMVSRNVTCYLTEVKALIPASQAGT